MLNRGFSAWIMTNGQILPEYLHNIHEDANAVSCWIPGVEGQTFAVYWQDHGGNVDTCSFITLDGSLVPGRYLFGKGIASRGGVRTSASTERPFVFQKMSENVDELHSQGVAMDASLITLKIKRVRRESLKAADPLLSIPSILSKRKAGELCIGFGEAVTADLQHPVTWAVRPYEEDIMNPQHTRPRTYVTFKFRYRSLGEYSLRLHIRLLKNNEYLQDFLTKHGIVDSVQLCKDMTRVMGGHTPSSGGLYEQVVPTEPAVELATKKQRLSSKYVLTPSSQCLLSTSTMRAPSSLKKRAASSGQAGLKHTPSVSQAGPLSFNRAVSLSSYSESSSSDHINFSPNQSRSSSSCSLRCHSAVYERKASPKVIKIMGDGQFNHDDYIGQFNSEGCTGQGVGLVNSINGSYSGEDQESNYMDMGKTQLNIDRGYATDGPLNFNFNGGYTGESQFFLPRAPTRASYEGLLVLDSLGGLPEPDTSTTQDTQEPRGSRQPISF